MCWGVCVEHMFVCAQGKGAFINWLHMPWWHAFERVLALEWLPAGAQNLRLHAVCWGKGNRLRCCRLILRATACHLQVQVQGTTPSITMKEKARRKISNEQQHVLHAQTCLGKEIFVSVMYAAGLDCLTATQASTTYFCARWAHVLLHYTTLADDSY